MQRSRVGRAVVGLARNRCTRRFRLQTTGLSRTTLCVNSVSLGKFKSEGGFGADDLCSLCPAGRHAFHDGATACDVCEVVRASASDGTSACEACQAGCNGVREGLTTCGACELGRHDADDGASFCDTCPRGTTATATACTSCARGTHNETANCTECTRCATGQFANVSRSSRCHRCCDVVNPGRANAYLWVTMEQVTLHGVQSWSYLTGANSDSSCGCDVGAWMSLSSECAECGQRMVCPGMGSVTFKEGYFALLEDPANVWACHGVQERCPAGAPGTYAENRPNTSIACGDCKSGTRATTSGPCADCQATDVLLLVGLLLLLLVFFALQRTEQNRNCPLHL